jgi:hypothetical protein
LRLGIEIAQRYGNGRVLPAAQIAKITHTLMRADAIQPGPDRVRLDMKQRFFGFSVMQRKRIADAPPR